MENEQKLVVSGLLARIGEIDKEIHEILGIQEAICPDKGIEIHFRAKTVIFDADGRIVGEYSRPPIPSL